MSARSDDNSAVLPTGHYYPHKAYKRTLAAVLPNVFAIHHYQTTYTAHYGKCDMAQRRRDLGIVLTTDGRVFVGDAKQYYRDTHKPRGLGHAISVGRALTALQGYGIEDVLRSSGAGCWYDGISAIPLFAKIDMTDMAMHGGKHRFHKLLDYLRGAGILPKLPEQGGETDN